MQSVMEAPKQVSWGRGFLSLLLHIALYNFDFSISPTVFLNLLCLLLTQAFHKQQ